MHQALRMRVLTLWHLVPVRTSRRAYNSTPNPTQARASKITKYHLLLLLLLLLPRLPLPPTLTSPLSLSLSLPLTHLSSIRSFTQLARRRTLLGPNDNVTGTSTLIGC